MIGGLGSLLAAAPTPSVGQALLLVGGAVAALLVLILAVRLHAVLALLLVSFAVAVLGGVPLLEIVPTIQTAMGGILGYITLVIGLGAIFGEMLERSGGARRLALALLDRAGAERAPAAFAATGLLVAIPVFFDVGFILLLPLLHQTARRTGRTVLAYALPLLAGLAVAHAFIPPTPGPVAVAGLLGAELGWVIVLGLATGLPALAVAGLIYGPWIAERIKLETPAEAFVDGDDREDEDELEAPGFGLSLALLALPLVLIVAGTAATTWSFGAAGDVLRLLGHPIPALLLTVLASTVILGKRCGWSPEDVEGLVARALRPVGLILLVTGAGGVLGKVLLATGAGQVLANALESTSIPIFVLAFLLALAVRIAQGSATVSMVTAAGLAGPLVEGASMTQPALALLTLSIAAGATAVSHVNDSGFWLVSRYLGLSTRDTLRAWTALTLLLGLTGLAAVLLIAPFVS
ncbi:MAG: gluconate:H+ symporter [Acidobacteriota bacterium]